MIVEERLVTYINSLDSGNTPLLEEIEAEAKKNYVPVIRKEMQSFLKVFLKMKQPKRILEVGTAVGFSAVFMAQYGEPDAEITTIENYEKRIPIARENFEKSGFADRITLIPGDAAEVLKTLDGPYDFIFMDAAKGQYIHFLPEVLRVLDKNGEEIELKDDDEDEFIPGVKDEMFESFTNDDEIAAEGYTIEDIPEQDDEDFNFDSDDYSEEDE